MKIDFTKEQFELLLKAVYLGNWMVRFTEESTETDFDTIEGYVFSLAKKFGLEHYVNYYDEEGKCSPSKKFEESPEIEGLIQRYDDFTFWEKLIYNLARRDMDHKYSERGIARMSPEEHLAKEQPFIEKYEKEFETHGLKNLVIKPPKQPPYSLT
ncbi:MAG: hypothetical protein LBQ00_03875 [Syntrophobacterales bacterium]|jgi:hypothetical protein|nr:hypothetical protein [Syntrophobacterales bacterium]